jgi:hypothetical protein
MSFAQIIITINVSIGCSGRGGGAVFDSICVPLFLLLLICSYCCLRVWLSVGGWCFLLFSSLCIIASFVFFVCGAVVHLGVIIIPNFCLFVSLWHMCTSCTF